MTANPLQAALIGGCPLCGLGYKVQRTIARGRKAGQRFTGCSRYPFCKYFVLAEKGSQGSVANR